MTFRAASRRAMSFAAALALGACASTNAAPSASPGRELPPPEQLAVHGGGVELVTPVRRASRPPNPPIPAQFRTALVADHCTDRDIAAPPASDPALTLLDRTYGLPLDYAPADLVPASAAGFTGPSASRLVSGSIVDDLTAMRAAWAGAGLTISIDSAYRSAADQAETFAWWTARLGEAAARLRTARPGHSEHQLGTALDFSSPGWAGRLGDWATESREGAWMAEHGWEFGFVMSYPAGDGAASCYGYEPWHYRWVGRDVAAEHRASGVSLRRFLERYVTG